MNDNSCGRYSIWFWSVRAVSDICRKAGANMGHTACGCSPVDPTGYFDFFDRHFGLGDTVRELSGIWLQYSSVLRRSAISHRHHPLWRMVSHRLNAGIFDVHEVLLLRAGNPSVYNPQCANSGPTGLCVRHPLDPIVLY
jgi:hypothetical protein